MNTVSLSKTAICLALIGTLTIPAFGRATVPSDAEAWKVHYIAGRNLVWKHAHAQAIPELEKALAGCAPGQSSAEIIDVNAKLLHCYVERKQWDKAENLAGRLIKNYPDRAYEWNYELGRSYIMREDYIRATGILESAAETTPKTATIAKYLYKAILDCYDETDRLDKAIPLAEKLLAADPNYSGWQWRLGWYYLNKKQYEKAASLFEKVTKSSKAAWEIRKALIFRGECLYKMGKGEEALTAVDAYFKDRPAQWDDRLLVRAGVLFYGARDDTGCVAALTELLSQVEAGKKSSLVSTARELMCKSLVRKGDWAAAGSMAEKTWTGSKDPYWLVQAGEGYYKAGDYAQAKRVYKAGMDSRGIPADVRAQCMNGLALCYWDTGLKDAARRLAERVMTEYSGTLAATSAMNSLNSWTAGR